MIYLKMSTLVENEFYLLSNTPATFNQFLMDLFFCLIISRIQHSISLLSSNKKIIFMCDFCKNIFINIILQHVNYMCNTSRDYLVYLII